MGIKKRKTQNIPFSMNRCRPDQLVCIGFLECHACRGYQAEKRYKSLVFLFF